MDESSKLIDISLPEFEEIGEIAADNNSPSSEIFKFKAFHDKSASPGTIVAVEYAKDKFIIGRVSSSQEHNPHYAPEQLSVKHALDVQSSHPDEQLSFTIYRLYEVEIIDEIHIINKIPIVRPAQTMPKAGFKVIIPPQNFIYTMLGLNEENSAGFNLGNIATSIDSESKMPVILDKEIIQRHVFIGGTTGGGKSYAAKVLAEEIHKTNLPIIFFDTQYEFVPLTEKLNGNVLIPGENYKVKLSSLTPDEIQKLIPTITNDQHINVLIDSFLSLKSSGNDFGSKELIEEVIKISESRNHKNAPTLMCPRIEQTLKSYNFLGNDFNWGETIKKGSVININCKGINRNRLQLILAATLRELQTLRHDNKILPYSVFVDEAHLFVPQDENSACKQIIREGVRIGRHNGICFILITQSPIDIDKKVIRQCNTRLLFAIEPDQLIALQGVKSDATQNMLDKLPKSPVGTCLLSGTYETIKHAIPVQIRLMETQDADGGKTPDIFTEVQNNEDGKL